MKFRRIVTALLALLLASPALALATATGTASPYVALQYFTNAGAPAAGYQLFTYTSGTSTKASTYTDVALSSANTNPIILDSAGRCTIFLTPGLSYKYVLAPPTDTDPPLSPTWTRDNVSAVPPTSTSTDVDVAATAGENLSAGNVVYLSDGSGSLTAGRWYRTDADNAYSSATAPLVGMMQSALASGVSGTVRIQGRVTGLSGLAAGALEYVSATTGSLTGTAPSGSNQYVRLVGAADSTTSMLLGSSIWGTIRPRRSIITGTSGNTGAGEQTVYTYNGTADINDNQYYHFLAWGQTANNANVKTIRVRLIEGANNAQMMTFVPTAAEAGQWKIEVTIWRTSGSSARSVGYATVGPTNGPVSRSGTRVIQPTITWANAYTITLSFDATANNDITVEGGFLELMQ